MIDLLIEVDRSGRGAYNASKFTAYDHFLGGWCLRTRHWGRERRSRPIVVFVAHSPQAMLTLLAAADQAMTPRLRRPRPLRTSPVRLPRPRPHRVHLPRLAARRPRDRASGCRPCRHRCAVDDTELRPERVALLPEELVAPPLAPG